MSEPKQARAGASTGVETGKARRVRPALRVVFLYLVFASAWIFLSGWAVGYWATEADVVTRWETYKGWTFVAVTAALLYLLLDRTFARERQAQISLEQSEERYRRLVTASPDAVLIQVQKTVAFVNPAAVRIFGARAPEELIGKSIFDLVHPDDHPLIHKYSTDVLRRSPADLLQVRRLRRLDESTFFGELAISATDFQGQPGLMALIRDVTDRRRTEAALVESETRLRLALAAAHQGLYDVDLRTGAVVTNDEYALMLGYDPADFQETVEGWLERLHPDDRERVADSYRAYLAGRLPEYRVECRQRTRDGNWKWILTLGKVVASDAEDRPIRVLGTHTDITPQKLAEQRVRKLSRLQAALSLTNETILRRRDRGQLFEEICRISVQSGGLHLAWIGTLDPFRNQLAPVARSGIPAEAPLEIPITSVDAPVDNPVALALHRGGNYVCNYFEPAPQLHGWWTAVLEHGGRAAAILPLSQAGRIIGALGLGADAPGFFDGETMVLLEELARDISFALDSLELEAQRAQATAALRESEARFRRIIDTASEGMLMTDERWQIMFANRQLATMLGYAIPDLIGRPVTDLLFSEDLADHRRQVARRRQGLSDSFERRLRRQDNSAFWALVSATPVLNDSREFTGTFAMLTDITQRKQAEQALRESEQKFAAFMEFLPGYAYIKDAERRHLFANKPLERRFSVGPSGWQGKTCEELLSSEAAEVFRPSDEAVLARREPLQVEETLVEGDLTCTYLSSKFPIIRKDKPVLLGGISIDITERRNAVQALHELSGRLLRLQDEERRRIARELHDTTTQDLAALQMNIAALQSSLPELNDRLRQLLQDCNYLADKSTREIRTLSYLLHPPMLEMLGLPGALTEFVSGFARRSGIATQFEAPQNFGRLPGEVEMALFRVVQEALGNIHRHSGSPTAQVSLWREGTRVTVEVADQGRGIAPEVLTSLTKGTAALGVGIAGMRERLHQLGGRLDLESSPAGTRVRAHVELGKG